MQMGMTDRDLAVVFRFLSDKTLFRYIQDRKMNAAGKHLLDEKHKKNKYDINGAISISGLCDQPTFTKSFKRMFTITPKKFYEKDDQDLLTVKLSWNRLSEVESAVENIETQKSEENISDTICGVDAQKFSELEEIVSLKEFYSFDGLQCNVAHYISTTYDIPLKDAFRFVSEYNYDAIPEWSEDDDEDCPRLSREEYYNGLVKEDADDPELRYIYFEGEAASIFYAFQAYDQLHDAGIEDITKVDIDAVMICAYNEIDANYCIKAVKYYKDHADETYDDDSFREYLEAIFSDVPIEIAFEDTWPGIDWMMSDL